MHASFPGEQLELHCHTARRIAIAAAITLTSASAFATTINTVVNGGFESPVVNNFGYLGGTTTGGWTFTGFGTGIAVNGSAFNVVNPSGNQAALLQGAGVSISQAIDFSQGIFSISFLAEGRGAGYGANTISVLIDGVALTFSGATTLTPGTTSSFTQYTTDYVLLTAGLHTLSFAGLGNNGGDRTTFIDNVSVNVPEPVTLGLFGLGLVALGAARRKTKNPA